MPDFAFRQVDVFAERPLLGNPLAVVHAAEALETEQMAALARWTGLSETTFLLPPTRAGADYRLRIFTPRRELPFAGHPTLGSCHAWLEAGGIPQGDDVVQECAVGLVRIRRGDGRLAFAAPPLRRSGPPDAATRAQVLAALRLAEAEVTAMEWVDNGPGWLGVLLPSRAALLALRPDPAALQGLTLGAIAPAEDTAFEVRALIGAEGGVVEDPVTGSLNASLAQWLIGAGLAPAHYVAAQGSVLQREGRVHVDQDGETLWIGGHAVTVIEGRIRL